MRYTNADILDIWEQYDVLVHGCNCFHTMGKGVAAVIKDKWPFAMKADLKTKKGDREKLGTLSYAVYDYPDHKFTVVNAYTQYNMATAKNKKVFDYKAMSSAMSLLKKSFGGKRILMPMIGAGLAGGDWGDIRDIIERELSREDVVVAVPNEETYYDLLTEEGLRNQGNNIESYKKGAHSLMGVFVGKSMKSVHGNVDHVKLSNKIYNYIKNK